VEYLDLDSATKIVKEFVNPKLPGRNVTWDLSPCNVANNKNNLKFKHYDL
jgi:hypothetical protein